MGLLWGPVIGAVFLTGLPEALRTANTFSVAVYSVLLLVAIVPVFGLFYWALRKRFRAARQARIVRPPGV